MAYRASVAYVQCVSNVRTNNHGCFTSVTLPARNIHGVLRYCHAAEVHQDRLLGVGLPWLVGVPETLLKKACTFVVISS
ncbi:MAG: hypothetical protein ACOCX9_04960 [Spirochaetota bacterium]